MALLDGLQAYWKLEEPDAQTRLDSQGDHDLVDRQTVARIVGIVGSGASFIRANSEFLEASGSPSISFGDEPFTVAHWVFLRNATNSQGFLSKWIATTDDREYGTFYRQATNRYRFVVSPDGTGGGNAAGVETTNAPTVGQWQFLVAWHDPVANTINLQLNNDTPDSTAWANGVNDNPLKSIKLGVLNTAAGDEFNDGAIDAVGIWNRVLTSSERAQLYNNGNGLQFPFNSPPLSGFLGGYLLSGASGPVSGVLGGYLEGDPFTGPTGIMGGYLLAQAPEGQNNLGLLGGLIQGPVPFNVSGLVGGFLNARPLTDAGPLFWGGYASGATTVQGNIGGFVFGKPDETQFVATRARTLVGVTSQDVVDQDLNIDAKIIFKGVSQADFNAKFDIEKTSQGDITAEFEVEKFRVPPSVFITSVDVVPGSGEALPSGQPVPNFDPSGVRRVCVTASGTLGDAEEFVNAYIDFGDPFDRLGGFKRFQSVSGFTGGPPWTACHVYDMSGVYSITARAQDNDGMVGMAVSGLNLASGAGFGTDFPAIEISGVPRVGIVPPSLQVDFTTQSSGLFVPPYTQAQSNASQVQSPTDDRVLWNFGNRETSVRSAPTTFYSAPGLYIPALRYIFTNPSGGEKFTLTDTLFVGFNL